MNKQMNTCMNTNNKRPKYILDRKVIFSNSKKKILIKISNANEEQILHEWLDYYTGCTYIEYTKFYKDTPIYYKILKNGDIITYEHDYLKNSTSNNGTNIISFFDALTVKSKTLYFINLYEEDKEKIKPYYTLHDLDVSNNRSLEYYKNFLNHDFKENTINYKNIESSTCKAIVDNLKAERKEILERHPVRQELKVLIENYKFNENMKDICEDTANSYELICLRQNTHTTIENMLLKYEWLIPPFARLNNLVFVI